MIPAGPQHFPGCRRESARLACGGSFRPAAWETALRACALADGFLLVSGGLTPCFLEHTAPCGAAARALRAGPSRPVHPSRSREGKHPRAHAGASGHSCGWRGGVAGCASSGARLCGEYLCRKSSKSLVSWLLPALSPLVVKLLPSAPQPAPSLVQPLPWLPAKTSPTAASSVARSALFRARSCRPRRTATNIFQDIAGGVSPAH